MGKPRDTGVSKVVMLSRSNRSSQSDDALIDSASGLLDCFLGPHWWKVSLQRDFLQLP